MVNGRGKRKKKIKNDTVSGTDRPRRLMMSWTEKRGEERFWVGREQV